MKRNSATLFMLPLMLLFGCSAPQQNTDQEIAATQNVNTNPTVAPAASPAPTLMKREYSKNLDELRASFNRDKGKVRLLTLLSPT